MTLIIQFLQGPVKPGAGMPKFGKPTRPSGAHGLKWVDGKIWMAMPPAEVIQLIEPETGAVIRSIPGPGIRTHGIAWDNGYLWVAETIDRAIYKLDPKDGRPLAKIQYVPPMKIVLTVFPSNCVVIR